MTVNGDQLADAADWIIFELISSGPDAGGLRLTLDGEAANFAPGSISQIVFNSGAGADAAYVDALPRGVSLTLNMGGGNDSVRLASFSGEMDNVQGDVTINGAGTTALTLEDEGTFDSDGGARHHVRYRVEGGAIERADMIEFPGRGRPVEVITGVQFSGLSQVFIWGPQSGAEFDVLADSAPLTIDAGISPNLIVVGDAEHTLDNLVAPLTINGHSLDSLVLDDRAVSNDFGFVNQVTFDLSQYQVVRTNSLTFDAGDGPLTFTNSDTISFVGIADLTIEGGPTGNTFNVLGTSAATRIDAGLGVDAIIIGNGFGTLDDIQGGLTIADYGGRGSAPGPDEDLILIVDGGNTTSGQSYLLSADGLTHDGAAPIIFGSPSYGLVLIEAGSGGNVITVAGTPADTVVELFTGSGDDQVNVLATGAGGLLIVEGDSGNDLVRVGSVAESAGDTDPHAGVLAGIQGALIIQNAFGTTTLVIDDSGDSDAHSDAVIDPNGLLSGVAPADITWSVGSATIYLPETAADAAADQPLADNGDVSEVPPVDGAAQSEQQEVDAAVPADTPDAPEDPSVAPPDAGAVDAFMLTLLPLTAFAY